MRVRRQQGFQMVPAPVATCQWQGCDLPTREGIRNVLVRPEGESLWRKLDVVPLCGEHITEVQTTGHLLLSFHPDEAADQDLGAEVGSAVRCAPSSARRGRSSSASC